MPLLFLVPCSTYSPRVEYDSRLSDFSTSTTLFLCCRSSVAFIRRSVTRVAAYAATTREYDRWSELRHSFPCNSTVNRFPSIRLNPPFPGRHSASPGVLFHEDRVILLALYRNMPAVSGKVEIFATTVARAWKNTEETASSARTLTPDGGAFNFPANERTVASRFPSRARLMEIERTRDGSMHRGGRRGNRSTPSLSSRNQLKPQ